MRERQAIEPFDPLSFAEPGWLLIGWPPIPRALRGRPVLRRELSYRYSGGVYSGSGASSVSGLGAATFRVPGDQTPTWADNPASITVATSQNPASARSSAASARVLVKW